MQCDAAKIIILSHCLSHVGRHYITKHFLAYAAYSQDIIYLIRKFLRSWVNGRTTNFFYIRNMLTVKYFVNCNKNCHTDMIMRKW